MRHGRLPSPIRLLPLLGICALLAACSGRSDRPVPVAEPDSPRATSEKGGVYKIGKPYQVKGVWYYPQEDFDYDESGIASWYGPNFHQNLTANGEIFDQNEISAAHRTLPLPSLVRVSNLDNGRSLIVRVNDRGPYAHGRILDLSRKAAQLLGVERNGTARVRVQILADESRALAASMRRSGVATDSPAPPARPRDSVMAETLAPPPGSKDASRPVAEKAPPPPPRKPDLTGTKTSGTVTMTAAQATQIYIQTGAFTSYDNALRMSTAVRDAQISPLSVNGGAMVYRVRIGPVRSVNDADSVLERVIKSGYPDARIVVD